MVRREQGETFTASLSHEQPIEWVTMKHRKREQLPKVTEIKLQWAKAIGNQCAW